MGTRGATGRSRARRAGLGALAAALLTGSALLGPAAGADDTADPEDGAPFGDRVEPGTSLQDTTVLTSGTYTLPMPERGRPHFFEVERAEPGETVWYGVTALPSTTSRDALLELEGTAGGDSRAVCNDRAATAEYGSYVTSLFSSNRVAECREAESITLQVDNIPFFGRPFGGEDFYQLTVWVEPAVTRTDTLPGPNENSPWEDVDYSATEARPTEGSTTFESAQVLAEGLYETTVLRGEARIFAFPLTYGQHAQVVATTVEEDPGSVLDLSPVWISPLGGLIRAVEPLQSPLEREMPLSGETSGVWSTPIVTHTNRERLGDPNSAGPGDSGIAAPAAFAGTYFLLLELPVGIDDEIDESDYPAEVDIRLGVEIVTDYEGSVPPYDAEPAPLSSLDGSGFAATAAQRRAQELADRRSESEGPPWTLAAGLLAGAALLAVVGGVAVGRLARGRS